MIKLVPRHKHNRYSKFWHEGIEYARCITCKACHRVSR